MSIEKLTRWLYAQAMDSKERRWGVLDVNEALLNGLEGAVPGFAGNGNYLKADYASTPSASKLQC